MLKNEEVTLYKVMISGHNSLDIFTKLEWVKDLAKSSFKVSEEIELETFEALQLLNFNTS